MYTVERSPISWFTPTIADESLYLAKMSLVKWMTVSIINI